MFNAFPTGSEDTELRLRSVDAVLVGVPSEAICEAAQRFTGGLVEGQSARFAPSVAEFAQEARRISALLPYRGQKAIAKRDDWKPQPPEHRIRMGFKMSMLSAAFGRENGTDKVKEANEQGLEYLIALAQVWGVPVPPELESPSDESAVA